MKLNSTGADWELLRPLFLAVLPRPAGDMFPAGFRGDASGVAGHLDLGTGVKRAGFGIIRHSAVRADNRPGTRAFLEERIT